MGKRGRNPAGRGQRPTEHQIQSAYAEWWEAFAPTRGIDHRLGFAIPNGGMRHPAVAAKLKAEGVKSGIPDWLIAVPRSGFNGLFIEFKSETGRVKPGQAEIAVLLTLQGYKTCVCRSVGDAIARTTGYLGPEYSRTPVDCRGFTP